ncbi:hypothetical protein BJY52DRAFT_45878 [Lactarius psammicola]|nr:hypothetical protein BJY52DRAFT_45878 [Lactarius psammicola]
MKADKPDMQWASDRDARGSAFAKRPLSNTWPCASYPRMSTPTHNIRSGPSRSRRGQQYGTINHNTPSNTSYPSRCHIGPPPPYRDPAPSPLYPGIPVYDEDSESVRESVLLLGTNRSKKRDKSRASCLIVLLLSNWRGWSGSACTRRCSSTLGNSGRRREPFQTKYSSCGSNVIRCAESGRTSAKQTNKGDAATSPSGANLNL